jgi:hypothetical protein
MVRMFALAMGVGTGGLVGRLRRPARDRRFAPLATDALLRGTSRSIPFSPASPTPLILSLPAPAQAGVEGPDYASGWGV